MRGLSTFFSLIAVIGLGYWAYHQTILTQAAIREVNHLTRAIGIERDRLSVLRAEWAYLNRPDRLRELADFNFERLGLMPLAPDQFGAVTDIPLSRDVEALINLPPPEALLDNASTPEQDGEP